MSGTRKGAVPRRLHASIAVVNDAALSPISCAPIERPLPGWIERARPLLGTLVRVGVAGLDTTAAHAAIDRAFQAIESIHRLMSFHEVDSDVTRLNRNAAHRAVSIDWRTAEVLQLAQAMSAASDGIFDITIAPRLVAAQFLPPPDTASQPHSDADWRDIDLDMPTREVRFRRPLWLDLGGIAKGYAVDAACDAMRLPPQAAACVNAGGDLRVCGPWPRRVVLDAPDQDRDALPMIEVTDGAVASSSGFVARRLHGDRWCGAHVDGRHRSRGEPPPERFASVVAPRCAIADALTKLALFAPTGSDSPAAFERYRATAHVYTRGVGWRTLGHAA